MRRLLAAILAVWLVTVPCEAAEFVHLTLEGDGATERTVSWRSAVDEGAAVYYMDAAGKNYFCRPQAESYIIEGNRVWFYTAHLTGLSPNEVYRYRVIDAAGAELASGEFRTAAAAAPVRLVVCGDSQSIDYAVWQQTLTAAVQQAGQVDLLVNNGDLVDNGSLYSEWQRWFDSGAALLPQLTLVPVVGNHEVFAADYRQTHAFNRPELFCRQFALPQNGPAGLTEQVYSFDYGQLHIVVLDTQFAEARSYLPDSWARQLAWLRSDLAASAKAWKIVFMHKPFYHNRADASEPDKRFGDLETVLAEGGVAAVFTAHDHVLARTVTADGVAHIACGRSGTKVYPNKVGQDWNEWFVNPVNEPVYLLVDIDSAKMTVTSYSSGGVELDNWQLERR